MVTTFQEKEKPPYEHPAHHTAIPQLKRNLALQKEQGRSQMAYKEVMAYPSQVTGVKRIQLSAKQYSRINHSSTEDSVLRHHLAQSGHSLASKQYSYPRMLDIQRDTLGGMLMKENMLQHNRNHTSETMGGMEQWVNYYPFFLNPNASKNEKKMRIKLMKKGLKEYKKTKTQKAPKRKIKFKRKKTRFEKALKKKKTLKFANRKMAKKMKKLRKRVKRKRKIEKWKKKAEKRMDFASTCLRNVIKIILNFCSKGLHIICILLGLVQITLGLFSSQFPIGAMLACGIITIFFGIFLLTLRTVQWMETMRKQQNVHEEIEQQKSKWTFHKTNNYSDITTIA